MGFVSPKAVESLKYFLTEQISQRKIDFLIPLETKGALIVDYVYSTLNTIPEYPIILYLRSLEYLPLEVKLNSKFALFDDFVFSGRTLSNAYKYMRSIQIPPENIHMLAFFKFESHDRGKDVLPEIISKTSVPQNTTYNKLSQEGILNSVQKLALDQKIPASYDNLHWDIKIDNEKYTELMKDLSLSSWYVYYGKRGRFDASVLIVDPSHKNGFDSFSKIRFWYDSITSNLVVSPIAYPSVKKSTVNNEIISFTELLLPENVTTKQYNFCEYQARAIVEQIKLHGYLIPYYTKYSLTAILNKKHINRYYGPRASTLINYIQEKMITVDELKMPKDENGIGERIDFYWITLEIMHILGKVYWLQKSPRKKSKGFSASEILKLFLNLSSKEAIHAAIDYCADMNFIATFYDWKGNYPKRCFRLTENGEAESGRNDGQSKVKLSYFEKLGALIISKTKNKKAYWWMLEKIPALLIKRFKFPLPNIEATKSFFGDTSKLKVEETNKYFLHWPQINTQVWKVQKEPSKKKIPSALIFNLDIKTFEEHKTTIYQDMEIMSIVGAVETLMEVTNSKTHGHHLAIFLDILSDQSSGTTYLAHSLREILSLINVQNLLSDQDEIKKYRMQINNWFNGFNEKTKILVERQAKLLTHLNGKEKKLAKQNRETFAMQLTSIKPFPVENKIIPSLRNLSAIVKSYYEASLKNDVSLMKAIYKEIVAQKNYPSINVDIDYLSHAIQSSIIDWTYALSGEVRTEEEYIQARLNIPKGQSCRMFVVAYDLLGSSGSEYIGRNGADRDRRIQSIISNWFIAFGGYTQRTEFGGGDLGFGFFHTIKSAILASSWASYHLNLLKSTDRSIQQDFPHAGFGIVPDELNSGFMEQIKSDWLSRFAKAWKREAEHIAERTGRKGLPLIAVQADMFSGFSDIQESWLGEESSLDNIQVRFIKEDILLEYPWRARNIRN